MKMIGDSLKIFRYCAKDYLNDLIILTIDMDNQIFFMVNNLIVFNTKIIFEFQKSTPAAS